MQEMGIQKYIIYVKEAEQKYNKMFAREVDTKILNECRSGHKSMK